jgi:hypothetical protein
MMFVRERTEKERGNPGNRPPKQPFKTPFGGKKKRDKPYENTFLNGTIYRNRFDLLR